MRKPVACENIRFSSLFAAGDVLRKAVVVYMQDRGFNSFASNIIKLSVNEAKWSSFLARTGALILFISTRTPVHEASGIT